MNYLIIVISIGMLILVHELGHFIAAKAVKIPVEKFSIGFGPRLFSFKRNETEYRISMIPLGGYVLPLVKDENDFFNIPVHKRIILSMGGPLANILLPLAVLAIMNSVKAGISADSFFIQPLLQVSGAMMLMVKAIPGIFSSPDNLSGIVGIVSQGGQVIGSNLLKIINFNIFMSLNLAVFNMLPFPVLDGGKILLYMLEKIHPKTMKLQLPLSIAGWIFIIGLMVYVTVLDVGRIIS